jgi:hypothetical protein
VKARIWTWMAASRGTGLLCLTKFLLFNQMSLLSGPVIQKLWIPDLEPILYIFWVNLQNNVGIFSPKRIGSSILQLDQNQVWIQM